MSGAQTSTFPSMNDLLAPMAAYDTHAVLQNRLMQQQQEISDHDIAMTGQAAAPLLNMSPEDAAAAYPGWLQDMQSRGLAKYAPATYPGHAATQALVQRAMPILQQIESGFLTPPGSADARKNINDIYSGGGTPSAQGGQPPPQGGPPGLATAESGGKSDVINAQGYTGTYQFGKQRLADLGYYTPAPGENMGDNTTWAGKVSVPGFNVTDQKSFAANPAAQNAVYQTHMANIDKAIDQMPNAGNFDRNGLRAVAHLGGIAGMERFASSGGMYDPADANGTRLSSYYKRFSGGAPGASPTAAATTAAQPVITGDSLASQGGLGGSGVVGASPKAVLAGVQADSRAGKYSGQPVVLSTGASNDPTDLASVEQQLHEAQRGNAGQITVLGVGPAVEAKAPGTNAKLQALAKSYGAQFVPLPADQMSPDGIHPTPQGYATLKGAIAPPQGAPGGVAARTGGTNVAGPGAGPGGAPGQPAAMPRDQAVAQAQRTGQAVPVAGVDGLWALPNGNLSGTPPAQAQPTPQPQPQIPQPPPNRTMPGSPDGPPAPTPAQQPAPAPRANLPRAADVPQGLNSPQIQQAQRLQQAASQIEMEAARNPFDKRLQAEAAAKAADLKQRAQILMQTDTVVQTQDGPLHVATGVIDKPIPHYVWDEKRGAYVDTTGSTAPVTPPSPRMTPVPGLGTLQSKPGGGAELLAPDIRKPALDALAADRPKIDEITQNGQAAQGAMLRLNEMSDIIPRLATGPSADLRTRGAAWLEQLGASPETIKRFTGMESGSLAEELIKLSIATAGQAAKTDVGSNNGIQSLQLYQSANPGIALLPDANKRMTNMARVYQQMSQDYTQGALAHFNPQQQAILNPNPEDLMTGKMSYSPISNYNQSWQERNNPQIGAAAMGILNGDTFDKWAARATPEQAAAAVAMAARIDPNVRVPTKDGLKPASVILAHPMTPAGR